jgi:hypothetical protein
MEQISYETARLDTLKSLLLVFADAFDEIETYQSSVPTDEYLESLLRSDNFIALVAISNDAVVGGLAAYVLKNSSSNVPRSTSTTSRFSNRVAVKASRPD